MSYMQEEGTNLFDTVGNAVCLLRAFAVFLVTLAAWLCLQAIHIILENSDLACRDIPDHPAAAW